MLRRLHLDQPDSFEFTPDNLAWAKGQITKYPEGRQASAVIALLWRAQEQEGWLTRPAIEYVSDMLDMAYMRALEVASFYFMFQLHPVGSVANIQICGTTSCMICGAEDLMAVCREKIAPNPHELSPDGRFSWEEVECLGACSNAPMAQIGKDYYEDLTAEKMGELIDALAAGEVPLPGPQNGRYASEPLKGLTTLTDFDSGQQQYNASVQRAHDIGDTIKRIDGTEVPLLTPWHRPEGVAGAKPERDDLMPPEGPDGKQGGRTAAEEEAPRDVGVSSERSGEVRGEAPEVEPKGHPEVGSVADEPAGTPAPEPRAHAPAGAASDRPAPGLTPDPSRPAAANVKAPAMVPEAKPHTLDAPRPEGADDLKRISGVGPKLEQALNDLGFYHFDQIANWSEAEVEWVDSRLTFKGRIRRDNWIGQARTFADEAKG
ncbi:NADH-quinone oxidoreductase subunit E [Thalassorhabdomicrobium marinisediminis]|uniref:Fused NADH-quinone oxidoreductase subunit E/endonuclease n=1 Tax=Thalassorhabdomicrobium marinisediminis TaxID=2170577 RepID=A0A2T7G0L0_9RHOB|nr:NADH-quinone oxidoreductase subunit E [Thalassorhabdomicrobium marinisediminis]PVA07962.1 fused NADH-quinone oxidoreductase subunit E/endonuclease [Thalassorhabdomicrobium marinisediminis]